MTMRPHLIACAIFAIGLTDGSARAGDKPSAAEAGSFLPMEQILAKAPGTLLEAELERKRGVWVYEVKTMGADGKVTKVLIDATSGDVK